MYNLGGSTASVADFVANIGKVVPAAAELISHGTDPLDFPIGADDSSLRARLGDLAEMPLVDGIADTVRVLTSAS